MFVCVCFALVCICTGTQWGGILWSHKQSTADSLQWTIQILSAWGTWLYHKTVQTKINSLYRHFLISCFLFVCLSFMPSHFFPKCIDLWGCGEMKVTLYGLITISWLLTASSALDCLSPLVTWRRCRSAGNQLCHHWSGMRRWAGYTQCVRVCVCKRVNYPLVVWWIIVGYHSRMSNDQCVTVWLALYFPV